MILLWGAPGDAPLDDVAAALARLGTETVTLDHSGGGIDVLLDPAANGTVHGRVVGDVELALDAVTAAYVRPNGSGDAISRAVAAGVSLAAWCDLASCTVVNRPAAMAANGSKPFQLTLVARHFAVPDTLVTTDAEVARRFIARHGRVVYKSLSGVRSIVSCVGDEQSARLADVSSAPTQFQMHVPGVDVRVHVVGATTFATEARSAADDYRYDPLGADLAAIDLPPEVAERCVSMCLEMGLVVGGADLRRTPAGEWVCFEVNPSPAFSYYERATGQPIAASIARLLSVAAPTRSNGRVQAPTFVR